jgi:hypothetical protein
VQLSTMQQHLPLSNSNAPQIYKYMSFMDLAQVFGCS